MQGWTFLVVPPSDPPFRFSLLDGDSVVLGRGSDATIYLPDTQASRQHCRMTFTHSGPVIEDIGSGNGVFVNGKRTERCFLRVRDRVLVGLSEIRPLGPLSVGQSQGQGQGQSSQNVGQAAYNPVANPFGRPSGDPFAAPSRGANFGGDPFAAPNAPLDPEDLIETKNFTLPSQTPISGSLKKSGRKRFPVTDRFLKNYDTLEPVDRGSPAQRTFRGVIDGQDRFVKFFPLPVGVKTERLEEEMPILRKNLLTRHKGFTEGLTVRHSERELCIDFKPYEGEPLPQLLKKGPFKEGQALGVALCVLDALEESELMGVQQFIEDRWVIVHEDKALVSKDFLVWATLKVLRDAEVDTFKGPFKLEGPNPYRAPEAANDPEDGDTVSEIFSLGVLLYVMLSGETPYQVSDLLGAAASAPEVQSLEQRDLGVRASTSELVQGMISWQPEDRPQSWKDVRTALKNAFNSL